LLTENLLSHCMPAEPATACHSMAVAVTLLVVPVYFLLREKMLSSLREGVVEEDDYLGARV